MHFVDCACCNYFYVGVFCFICSKELADVRWAEQREAISGPLVELATSKAMQWCCSKPHAPLLIQIASSASSGYT